MSKMKSLTEKVSERFSELKKKYSPILRNAIFDARVRVAYLQECLKDIVPKANKETIRNLAFSSLAIPATAITYSVPALASESVSVNVQEKINLEVVVSENISVRDYIKGKVKSKFPSLFAIYFKSLGELNQYEREFIDLFENLSENRQKHYGKEVYNNDFTKAILEELKKEYNVLTTNQKNFINMLKADPNLDLASVELEVNLSLGIIREYPDFFDGFSGSLNGEFKANALLNLAKIAREIEPQVNMSADVFLDKYCEIISVASEKMAGIFYNTKHNGGEYEIVGPFVDGRLDEKEYNLVKRHILNLVIKNENKMLALNIAEPDRMNELPINNYKEVKLWRNDEMSESALKQIVLPDSLLTLQITPDEKISYLDEKATDYCLIKDSSKQLENLIRNQKFIEKYYSELEDILTNKETFNNYLERAMTWSTQRYWRFKLVGVYTPDGIDGEKNPEKSIPYQFIRFLGQSDYWSKLNIVASYLAMGKFKGNVIGNCDETTSMIQYILSGIGLPSWGITVGPFKDGDFHRDIMISIPDSTRMKSRKAFSDLMNYQNIVSLYYPNKTQIKKVLKPLHFAYIVLPQTYSKGQSLIKLENF